MTSGSQDTSAPDTVPAQAATETDLSMPIGLTADENRQVPRSGEGEGSVGDTSNETETGQSASAAPRKEQ
ncbi:MAG: hypothetical protein M3Y28_02140 [Armatimonadota bacterium]|nr:hypothetical protein [Armatimonadota bacterium]